VATVPADLEQVTTLPTSGLVPGQSTGHIADTYKFSRALQAVLASWPSLSATGHTHTTADVTDMTDVTRTFNKSATVAAARTAIGAQPAGSYATLVNGVVPSSQLPASSGGASVATVLTAVGEVSFDDFGADDNARVTAMNAYAKGHDGGPSRAVRLPARQINTNVPIQLYSGLTLLGREGPSREFQRGTIWNWQGASGTSCLVFPTDGQTSQSYPADGSPRDITMRYIQFQGGSSTHWMPKNSMSGTDIAGKTLWYCEFKDCGWKNFNTVWWGYTTGCSFATGVSHFQAISDTAIFLGGSETTVFGNDGYSFAASSTATQTATPFMRSMLSKSTIGRCMITARGAGWGLTIEGGYNTTVTDLAIDAQNSSRINGKAMLITGGSGHVVTGTSIKGAMDAPSSTASVNDRAPIVVVGGTNLLIDHTKFTRRETSYPADSPVIHIGSAVADRAVVIGLNTFDGYNDPAAVRVARDGQALTVDPRVSFVVGA